MQEVSQQEFKVEEAGACQIVLCVDTPGRDIVHSKDRAAFEMT